MTAAVALAAGQALHCYRKLAPTRSPKGDGDATALLLSGGGNLSFFHLGVIKVLREHGLLPRILSGASAGAVIAALICTRSERELKRLHDDELAFIGFPAHEDVGHHYSAEGLAAALAKIIPDVTFAEAEELSGRSLNISLGGRDFGGIVCGPATTPHVLVRDAVRASCAVPYVYAPVVVHERRRGRVTAFQSGRAWIDGSFYADVPETFIKSRYGVRHTIVSLVNPAVRPFVPEAVGIDGGRVRKLMMTAARGAALGCARFGRLTAGAVPRARDMFDTACRMIQQPYRGDLVLTPSRRFALSEVLDQPSSDLVRRLSADGEARTRPRVDDVRAMTAAGHADRRSARGLA